MAEYIEQFWRSATDKDVARVMAGEVVEARFQDENKYSWFYSNLSGWSHYPYHWQDEASCFWRYCQVYAPDQWYIDKPEPGEGYRLLEKFPDEALQPGDEAFTVAGLWHKSEQARIGGRQVERIWYRRKIEQPKPEPKFKVGQRVMVARPKQKPSQHGGSDIDEFFGYADIVASVRENCEKSISYVLEGIDERAFPEDYLEAFVEPAVEPKHYTLQVGDTVETLSGLRLTVTEHGVEVT